MELLHGTHRYLVCEECQEVTELKEAGIAIYRYKLNIGCVEEEIKTGDVNIFVVLNTKDVAAPPAAITEADKSKIKCKRCQYIASHAHKLLKTVDEVERQHVTGICDHCRGKSQTKDIRTLCDELVAKYLVSKGIVCKCNKIWGAPTGESRSDTDLNRSIRRRFLAAGRICKPLIPGGPPRFRSDESMIQSFPFETDAEKARNKYLFPEDVKKKKDLEDVRKYEISSADLISDIHDKKRQEALKRRELETESGQMGRGQVERGQMERGQIDRGQMERGQMESGQMDRGQMDRGQMDRGQMDRGQMERGQMDRGQIERGQTERDRMSKQASGYARDVGYRKDQGIGLKQAYSSDIKPKRDEPQYRERAKTPPPSKYDKDTGRIPVRPSSVSPKSFKEKERGDIDRAREYKPRRDDVAKIRESRPTSPSTKAQITKTEKQKDQKLPPPPAVQKSGKTEAVSKTKEQKSLPSPPVKADKEKAQKALPPPPTPPAKAKKDTKEVSKKDEKLPTPPPQPKVAKPEKIKEPKEAKPEKVKEPKGAKEGKALPVPPKPAKGDKVDKSDKGAIPQAKESKPAKVDKKEAAGAPVKDSKPTAPSGTPPPTAKEGKEKPSEKERERKLPPPPPPPTKGKAKEKELPKFKEPKEEKAPDTKAQDKKSPKGKEKELADKEKEHPKEVKIKEDKKAKSKGKDTAKEKEKPTPSTPKKPPLIKVPTSMKERELRELEKQKAAELKEERKNLGKIKITEAKEQKQALTRHKKKGSMILHEKDIKTTVVEPQGEKPHSTMLADHLKGLAGKKVPETSKGDKPIELKINEIHMATDKNTLKFALPKALVHTTVTQDLPTIPRKYALFEVTELKVADKKEGGKKKLNKYDKELMQKCQLKKRAGYPPLTRRSKLMFERRMKAGKFTDSDLELDICSVLAGRKTRRHKVLEAVKGIHIVKNKPTIYPKVEYEPKAALFKRVVDLTKLKELEEHDGEKSSSKGHTFDFDEDSRDILRYTLSDRKFIEKGWTMLPTEKVLKKMHVYRMYLAQPQFDWFKKNKDKGLITYDTGERLAEIDQDGRGRLYYKNNNLALNYYDSEEMNAQQRIVIYSSGEPDSRGRSYPITVLAMFDFNGNGIVFDHTGKIRLKYNQTEGVVLDRDLGPVTHWKWHSLNDPPVLQQVMIDTHMAKKDPEIIRLGLDEIVHKERPQDDEAMLAIEFDNFVKEKTRKLSQSFQPYQIKMKALRINNQFSLKILNQATVNLLFQDGPNHLKLNLGMILDHQEIIDTKNVEINDVDNSIEVFPAKTDSLERLQTELANVKKTERIRSEREKMIKPPKMVDSIDQLTAALSRPRPVLRGYPDYDFIRSMKPVSPSSSTV